MSEKGNFYKIIFLALFGGIFLGLSTSLSSSLSFFSILFASVGILCLMYAGYNVGRHAKSKERETQEIETSINTNITKQSKGGKK